MVGFSAFRPFATGRRVAACSLMAFGLLIGAGAGAAQAQLFGGYFNSRSPVYEPEIRPREAVAIVLRDGYRDVSRPVYQGDTYRIEATDPRGNRVRLLVDAYQGDIVSGRVIGRAERPGFAPGRPYPGGEPGDRADLYPDDQFGGAPIRPRDTPIPPRSIPSSPSQAAAPPSRPIARAIESNDDSVVKETPKVAPTPPKAAVIPKRAPATAGHETPVASTNDKPVQGTKPAVKTVPTQPEAKQITPKADPVKPEPSIATAPAATTNTSAPTNAARVVPTAPVSVLPGTSATAPAAPTTANAPATTTAPATITAPATPPVATAAPVARAVPGPVGSGTAASPRKIEIVPPAVLDDAPRRPSSSLIQTPPATLE